MTVAWANRLYTAQQSRALDAAIIAAGTDSFALMQRAAQAVFDQLKRHFSDSKCITVFAGAGNNGGDGFLVALLAQQHGWQVRVYNLIESEKLTGDAARAYHQAAAVLPILPYQPGCQIKGTVVDAILGTGCNKELSGNFLAAVQQINASPNRVCAVDIPSGLSADNGHIFTAAVKAELTVTFIGQKVGLWTQHGLDCCGKVIFAPLQTKETIVASQPYHALLLNRQNVPSLPPRPRHCHKGQFGHSLIIGGSSNMLGAAVIAAKAALRCGSALVTVACQLEQPQHLSLSYPETMAANGSRLDENIYRKATTYALGPGLGQGEYAASCLQSLLSLANNWSKAQVWDADALNWLAAQDDATVTELKNRLNWVLTPHPAEAARLLKTDVNTVQNNRTQAIIELTKRFNATVVLKGSASLITTVDSDIYLCAGGIPNLAGAGMGDCLTGWICALLAQGMDKLSACLLAVYLQVQAAKALLPQGRGLLAGELIESMRRQMQFHCPISQNDYSLGN